MNLYLHELLKGPKKYFMKPSSLVTYLILFSLSNIPTALAVDSGSVYQIFQENSLRHIDNKSVNDELDISNTNESIEDNGIKIQVKGYELYGNTLFTEDEIHRVLTSFTNQSLTITELHKVANELAKVYHEKGYFTAKVYIPPHLIYDGYIILQVYEGILEKDGIELKNSGNRIQNSLVDNVLQETLTEGDHINRIDFERAILLIDDLPGISSNATIYPGAEVGSARLLMETVDEPVISGNLDYDNFGGYYTGEDRLGATIYANSLFKHGEKITLRLATSGKDSNYGYINYTAPVSGNGLYVGASFDYLKYELDKEFRVLDNQGSASNTRLFMTYPFIRSRQFNVVGKADYSYLRLKDYNDTGTIADRVLHSGILRLSGDHNDSKRGGINYFDTSLTFGTVDLDKNKTYKQFDKQTADTQGGFAKLNFEVSRLQHLVGNLSNFSSISGQISNKNLDTSQKFFLGGPFSNPGYPTGELGGDDAIQLHLDLRYDLYSLPWGGDFQISTFYTYGKTKINHDSWDNWNITQPYINKKMALQSFGFGASQIWQDKAVIRAMIGWQVGDDDVLNPVNGDAIDNSDKNFRVWLNAITYF